jgi:hypothetical protein
MHPCVVRDLDGGGSLNGTRRTSLLFFRALEKQRERPRCFSSVRCRSNAGVIGSCLALGGSAGSTAGRRPRSPPFAGVVVPREGECLEVGGDVESGGGASP